MYVHIYTGAREYCMPNMCIHVYAVYAWYGGNVDRAGHPRILHPKYVFRYMYLLYMYNMDLIFVVQGARGFSMPHMYIHVYVLYVWYWGNVGRARRPRILHAKYVYIYMFVYMYNMDQILVVLGARGFSIPNIYLPVFVVYV